MTEKRLLGVAAAALLIELGLLISNYHFLWTPPKRAVDAVRIARVQASSNQVKVRSPIQLHWESVQMNQELYEGDEVATVGESQATLELEDGQRLELGANSLVVLRKNDSSQKAAFKLVLEQGVLRSQKTPVSPGARGILEIEVGGKKLMAQASTRFEIEKREEQKPRIDVSRGKVEVSDAVDSIVPSVAHPVLAKPQLKFPPIAATFDISKKNLVSLEWQKASEPGVEVTVEVARDSQFSDIVFRKTLRQPAAEFRAEKRGRYFWRVVKVFGVERVMSDVASFDIYKKLAPPQLRRPHVNIPVKTEHAPTIDPPSLNRPIIHYGDQSALDRFFDNFLNLFETPCFADEKPSNKSRYVVDLDWQSVNEAKGYFIQISSDPDFQFVLFGKTIPRNELIWKTDTAGLYYWRVAAIDSTGERGAFSEFNTFLIKAERNREGDESTYETYLKYDDYLKDKNRLSLFYGPEFTHYYFVGNNPISPAAVTSAKRTFANGQMLYSYWLNPHFSLEFKLRLDSNDFDANSYEIPGGQLPTKAYETIIALGLEKRFFEPNYFYTVQAGVVVSYIDLAITSTTSNQFLDYETFGFFGFYAMGGYHRFFGENWEAIIRAGGMFQHTGDSYRLSQVAIIEVKRSLGEWLAVGFWSDEVLSQYRMNATLLKGEGHSLSFRPMLFLEFKF